MSVDVTPITPSSRPRIARRARLQVDRITGKPVLLFPEGVLVLNDTGAAIAELCDGSRTVGEVSAILEQRYGNANVGVDVVRFLNRLHDRGLLQLMEAPS